ncbi:MAG: acyl-CoA reductase, partial [bacterium]
RSSCLNRVIFVKPIGRLEKLPGYLERVKPYLETVALEAPKSRRTALAALFSDAGVNRICRVGRMQKPSAFRPHDGRPNLLDFLTFTHLEESKQIMNPAAG